MDKCREEFESLAIAICADHKNWLKNNVYFKGKTYVPINHKNDFHCQHSAYFGFAFLMFCQQQKKIDELQKRVDEITNITTELAEYASYAEIVGGVTVNRSAVRSFCDKVFDFNRKVDQELEQAFKGDTNE